MSILVPINGVNYVIPTPGETGWGSNLDSFFVAIGAGCLQKIGGNFLLASEVDFGASFGLKSLYYKSESANLASTGIVRLANASDSISWRNAGNSADLALTVNTSNQLSFNGVPIESNALTNAHILVGNVSNVATDVAMSGDVAITNTGATSVNNVQPGVITNTMVNAAAAIAYSKLSLSNSIVNADINTSAAIVYSKLSLSNSIVNADINSAAAIVYSKLNLTGGIVNADVNAAAAIAYSKLNLTGDIVNADIATAAAIVRSKLAATETVDVTYASNKGMFWTDNTSNTIKLTAPTSVTTYTMKWPTAQGASNQYLTNDGSGNLSWTNAAGTGTVNTGTTNQLAYYASSTNAVSGLTLITGNKALASNASGLPVASTTTDTELGYVSGVTSAIQTQLNAKAPLASPVFTGTTKFTSPTANVDAIHLVNGSTEVFDINFFKNDGTTNTGFIELNSSGATSLVLNIGGTLMTATAAGVSFRGTNTNDNATTGNVGEYVESVISTLTNAPTSNNYGDLTSISLTAGDWDVSGQVHWDHSSATWSAALGGISTTSGNSSSGLTLGSSSASTVFASSSTTPATLDLAVPCVRMSLSATTTVYLKYLSTYSANTPQAEGSIKARRVR